MALVKCKGCGEMTASATSNWWVSNGKHAGQATKCFVRLIGGIPVSGCSDKKLSDIEDQYCRMILGKSKK